jgi:hypothetical protein
MVEKSLSMLKTPSSYNSNDQQPEVDQQENKRNELDFLNSEDGQQEKNKQENFKEPEKKSLGDLKTPETYQGQPDPEQEESTFGSLIRNISANASRLGEQYFGRQGNMEKMGKDILTNYPLSGGILGYALSELMGPERWERMVKGKGQNLPTSEQLKETSQNITSGYTKPKTPGEEKFQEYTESVGSTIGGGRPSTARNVLVNNMGIPLASEAVKQTVEGLGFGKDKATYTKLGAWTALSLLANVNAPKYASSLMNQGRNGIPDTLQFNVPRFQQRLQNVANDSHLLHADPRSALARQVLGGIQTDLQNGQLSVRSLMTSYDGVNAAKRNRGLFELSRDDRGFATTAIDRVRLAVGNEIRESSSQYPQAMQNWNSGLQAWAVVHQSKAMTKWIDSLVTGPYKKLAGSIALALFGVTSVGAYAAPAIAGPLALAVPAAYKVGQVAYRAWNDPRLARYYWDAISHAQQENIPAFINSYNKLNKGLEKSTTSKKDKKNNR